MSGPFPAAFYADKDGVVGVIAEDPDGDGRAGVVLRRAAGAWAVSADPKDKNRPLLDAGWFGDESLARTSPGSKSTGGSRRRQTFLRP